MAPDDEVDFYNHLDQHHAEYWQTLTAEEQERRL